MISHKYKFIFILLPKTGTTSIQSYLVKKDRKIPHLGTARHYDVINENVKKLEGRYPGGKFDAWHSENRKSGDL